jgi:hypothetical protein
VYTDRVTTDQALELPLQLQLIDEVHAHCQLALDQSQEVTRKYANWKRDNVEFAVGDWVWLEARNLSKDAPSKKLTAKRLGPYKITEHIGAWPIT